MELVSIIVPVFNTEKYIRRCVDSILSQSYTEIELILIDDGSTDQSGAICDQYAKDDSRVITLHQENKGLSNARNRGLDIATGEWITFVDSDDFIAQDFVEYMLKMCIKYQVDISECKTMRGTDDFLPEGTDKVIEKKWEFRKLYIASGRKFRVTVWAKLYKRNLFLDYHFPEGKINEDDDASFKLLYKAREIAVSDRYLYYYFQSENSITRKKRDCISYDFLEIYKDRIEFLKRNSEDFLIDVTKKELCIRLMMRYINARRDGMSSNELKNLLSLYNSYFKSINGFSQMPPLEVIALRLFYIFPDLFSLAENSMNIIKKAKNRRG